METPDGLVIRPLEPADSIAELTELMHRAYAHLLAAGLRYTAGYQTEETTRARISDGECYVGVLDGVLVATITLHDPSHTKGAPWYERTDVASFEQLCVAPELRGRGIAAALMDRAERRARDLGAAEIACDTAEQATELVEMYQRRSYRIVGRVNWGPTNYRSVILSKAL